MKNIVCDIESGDITAKHDITVPVWCIGFGWWDEDGGKQQVCLPWDEGKAVLQAYIDDPNIFFTFHNAPFDVQVLRLRGLHIPAGRYEDTMLRAYLLQPAAKEMHSLAAWGERLDQPKLDYRAKLIEAGLLAADAPKAAEYMVPFNWVMVEYNRGDIATTQELWEYTEYHLGQDPRVEWCYYNVELPYQEVLMDMEQGAFVDEQRLHTLGDLIKPQIDEAVGYMQSVARFVPSVQWKNGKYEPQVVTFTNQKRLNGQMVRDGKLWKFKDGGSLEAVGYKRNLTPLGKAIKNKIEDVHNLHYSYEFDHCKVEPINPNSSGQLAWYFQTFCGWKPRVKTPSGQPSVSADILKDEEHPFIEAYKKYAELQKLYGTFVEGLLKARASNGLVYGSYNQTTTLTCRLSSDRPNLQNIPARSDLGKHIREAFTAPPGYVLAIADLDRIEVVVLAFYLEYLFDDSRMADAIRAGVDVHQSNADAWFPDIDDRDKARRMAKDTIFAVLYGIMATSLSKRLHVTPDQAQSILDEVMERMPAIQYAKDWVWSTCAKRRNLDWVDIWTDEVATHGFMYDFVGHRLYYPDITARSEYDRARAQRQSFNALIQGSAGGIMKILHLQVWRVVRDFQCGRCFLAVHDENGVYLKVDAIRQKEELILDTLTQAFSSARLLVTDKGSIPVRGKFKTGLNWREAK